MARPDQPGDAALAKALRQASAPFGRIGAKLGFRWIMPIGTLPLPFHPGLALLLVWLVPALVLHRILVVANGQSGGTSWRGLFTAAALIALPMSVPILSWLMMAFRAPLLQALLIAGGMILVALDAISGALPAPAATVPAAWLGLFLVQLLGGPLYTKRLQADNLAFEAIVPGTRLVIVEKDPAGSDYGQWLFRHGDIPRLAVDPDPRSRSPRRSEQTLHRLSPRDLEDMAARLDRLRPPGWSVASDHVVTPGIDDPGAEAPIRVRIGKHRAPLWLIGGHRTMVEIDDGMIRRRVIGGQAALTKPLPLFVCYYWVAIFGGRSQWVAGFVRDKPVQLGTDRVHDLLARVFPPLPGEGAVTIEPTALLAGLERVDREQKEDATEQLDALLALVPDLPRHWLPLLQRPDLIAGHGAELCACLKAARAAKRAEAVIIAAQLLALVPEAEFQALSPEILPLLNSKELAFRLVDDPAVLDLPPHERSKHVIGGYSLVRRAPLLYERLAEYGEPARWLIMALGDLGRWPAPLARARDRLDARKGVGD